MAMLFLALRDHNSGPRFLSPFLLRSERFDARQYLSTYWLPPDRMTAGAFSYFTPLLSFATRRWEVPLSGAAMSGNLVQEPLACESRLCQTATVAGRVRVAETRCTSRIAFDMPSVKSPMESRQNDYNGRVRVATTTTTSGPSASYAEVLRHCQRVVSLQRRNMPKHERGLHRRRPQRTNTFAEQQRK